MKNIKAAILLSALILSVSGCGTINEETDNKRLRLEQLTVVTDDSSAVTSDDIITESKQSTSSAGKKEEIKESTTKETEKKIIEKAVNGNSSETASSELSVSVKTYLKDTTDNSPVTGIYDPGDSTPVIISVKPDELDGYFDIRCGKLKNAGAYSPEEALKLSSDMTKIQTDALEKYSYWRRSSVWEYQENFDYDPESYVTADLNPGKLNNVWLVDVHNPEGAFLYDARTLKQITVSDFFGNNWKSFIEDKYIEDKDLDILEYKPVQCFITTDEWSLTADVNYEGNPVRFTALYKNINPEYVDLE